MQFKMIHSTKLTSLIPYSSLLSFFFWTLAKAVFKQIIVYVSQSVRTVIKYTCSLPNSVYEKTYTQTGKVCRFYSK